MKRMVLIVFMLGSIPLFAQQVMTSIHGIAGFPLGNYGKDLDQIGYGPEVGVRISLPETPLWFGLDFGLLSLEQKKRYVSSSPGEIRSVNSLANLMAIAPLKGEIMAFLVTRVQIERETFIPYLEAMGGIQHFYSESVNEKDPIYLPENNASGFSTTEAARVFSGGFATGLMMHLYHYQKESENKIKNIYLDARLRSVFGGKIELVKENDTSSDDDAAFISSRVRATMITFQIGVLLEF